MKKKLKTMLIAIQLIMAITLTTYIMYPAKVEAQATPQIIVEPSLYHALKIGETFTIDINVNDLEAADRAVGVQFRVQYNGTLLEALDVSEGPFMQQFNNTVDPPYTYFTGFIEDDAIYGPNVLVGILLLPNGSGYWTNFPEGNGTLATVTFRVIYRPVEPDTATCSLDLSDTMIMDEDLLEISHTTVGGTYEVSQLPQPDLSVDPSDYTASLIGEVFDVDVNIADLDSDWRTTGVMFRVQYNGTLLEALDVSEGPFMQQFNNTVDPPYTYFIEFIEDDAIYGPNVLVGILLLPNGSGYWTNFPEGNGTLATVTFKAIGQSGEPDPPFSCELVLNDTQLINDVMGENPHTMSHGSYEIEPLSFSYEPSIPIAGQPVLFTAPEAIYSVTYSWSFGDGTSLDTTEPTAGHMYSMLGEYNVTLTCMTDGLASSVSKPIAIWPQGTTIEVTVDVGSIHFGGEIAEFNVLTTNYGETVNASITEALLYHNSGFYADLTGLVQSVSTGLHTISYSIPIAAETGTYTLVVKAEHYNAQGASMKSFQISQTLASWGTIITQIDNDIATIMTNLNYISLNLTAIDARLTSIIADIAIIDTEVGVLQTSVDNIDARLVDIEGDIAIIDSKLGAIQANVSDINARLVSIEGDIAVIDSAIGTIQTDLSSIDATVTEVEGDMATISTTVGEVDTKLDGVQATATTTLYAASILSAIAAILSAIILMTIRKR